MENITNCVIEDAIVQMIESKIPRHAAERDIGYFIMRLDNRLKASFDASLRDCGLTSTQAQVMEYVYWKDGQVTQKEIEHFMDVSHPTVVGIVSRLERKGFLTCHKDVRDKRNKIVRATVQTEQILEKMYVGRKATEEKLLHGFSKEEEEAVKKYLDRLYQNMKDKEADNIEKVTEKLEGI